MSSIQRYRDRAEAGGVLARLLQELDLQDPLVLGVPRGGVTVALEVARALQAPLDLVLVRKLPVPFAPEVAMGVIGEDGVAWHHPRTMAQLDLGPAEMEEVEARTLSTLKRYAESFADVRHPVPVQGRTVILVDDGVATGATLLGAVRLCRKRGASKVIVTAPVAAPAAAQMLEEAADALVCPVVDPGFRGVGGYYADFHQLQDEEVRAALRAASAES